MLDNVLAAFMFFTRLPFWKLKTVPQECFKHVVAYWSLSGWLTGGLMALSCWGLLYLFPAPVAVIGALIVRLLVTGALHEDGLADFFDGFGGGGDRESTLRIMKDSFIGSYGVIGLILYYLLGVSLLLALPVQVLPVVLGCADPFAKYVGCHILRELPYARKEAESKAKVVYDRFTWKEMVASALGGLLPLVFLPLSYSWMLIGPVVVFFLLIHLFRSRLGGYTGDCCGALFLLAELSAWMGAAIVTHFME